MLVLQSCTDSLEVLPGPSGESFLSSSDGACNFSNTEVDRDVHVKEFIFVAVNDEANIRIKQEEIPEDKNFPDTKSETDEVSCVLSMSVTFTFSHWPEILFLFTISIFLDS
jgi:hypothetical protein